MLFSKIVLCIPKPSCNSHALRPKTLFLEPQLKKEYICIPPLTTVFGLYLCCLHSDIVPQTHVNYRILQILFHNLVGISRTMAYAYTIEDRGYNLNFVSGIRI